MNLRTNSNIHEVIRIASMIERKRVAGHNTATFDAFEEYKGATPMTKQEARETWEKFVAVARHLGVVITRQKRVYFENGLLLTFNFMDL